MIRFFLTFLISFFILAFPTKKGTLFDDLHEDYLPFISNTYGYLFKQMHTIKQNTKDAAKKVFTSTPAKSITDKIQARDSSVQRSHSDKTEKVVESISPEDQELLRKIINEAR
jgi:hypothetical protein